MHSVLQSVVGSCSSCLVHSQAHSANDKFSAMHRAKFSQIPSWISLKSNSTSCTKVQPFQQGQLENLHLVSLAKRGKLKEAYEFLNEMNKSGILFDLYSYQCLLEACGQSKSLEEGRLFHHRISKIEGNLAGFLENCVLQMYCDCNSLFDAQGLFDKMKLRDLNSWVIIISGYTRMGFLNHAFGLFSQMLKLEIKPNSSIYVNLLRSLLDSSVLMVGKQLHAHIIKSDSMDASVTDDILYMYVKCGCMNDAEKIFEQMDEKCAVTCTQLMVGYSRVGKQMDVLAVFGEMVSKGIWLDDFVFSIVLKACAAMEHLDMGLQIHGVIIKCGLPSEVTVGTPLVDLYVKCGRLDFACTAFDCIVEPNDVSWSALIAGYSQTGNYYEAIDSFKSARSSGVLNSFMYTSIFQACSSLIDLSFGTQVHGDAIKRGLVSYPHGESAMITMYSKGGQLDYAFQAFKSLDEPDTVAWTAIISGCSYHGNALEALKIFKRMQDGGVRPNAVTFIAVLNACSHAGLVTEAKQYLDSMERKYGVEPTIDHYDCMIDVYARAGKLEEAFTLIKTMPCEPDAMSWKCLLGGCWMHKNLDLGKIAAENVLKMDPEDTAGYILMFNLYTTLGLGEEAANIRRMMTEKNLRKELGCSWTFVNGQVHRFIVGDRHHPQTDQIYAKLKDISFTVTEGKSILLNEDDLSVNLSKRKEQLLEHSEKLAIAFGLISTSSSAPLLVFKNIRACRHCHDFGKHASKITGREIVVRDANRFHHFKSGECSCNDYW